MAGLDNMEWMILGAASLSTVLGFVTLYFRKTSQPLEKLPDSTHEDNQSQDASLEPPLAKEIDKSNNLKGLENTSSSETQGLQEPPLQPSPEKPSAPSQKSKPSLEATPVLESKKPSKEPAPAQKRSEYKTLDQALSKTRDGFWGRIRQKFSGRKLISQDEIDDLEEILYTSDLGPKTVDMLISRVSSKISQEPEATVDFLQQSLKLEIQSVFENVPSEHKTLRAAPSLPTVWMVVGVNGAGKTTTIGKLASQQVALGKKVLIAAGDTFRAAADEQLKVWADRAEVEIFSPENVKDPSAVAFDAIHKGQSGGFDLVIVDTAGRLHTQKNLMEELKKMKRVIGKALDGAPHEILLVLDANSGQNALIQTEQFHQALDVSGVVLTKMDGSAKGGVAVGISHEHSLPIKLIGVGEKIEDLRAFDSDAFVDSIIH